MKKKLLLLIALNVFVGGLASANDCPLYFPSEHLCGNIVWDKAPSADSKSEFIVSFWKKEEGSSSGPFVDPKGQVGVFLRMTCCGSVSFPAVKKVTEGEYAVTDASFSPGNWEVYVQLKQGEQVDKQFVKVHVDD